MSPTPAQRPPSSFASLWRPLLVGAFVAAMAFVFLKLGSEVVEGETQGFDAYFLNTAHSLREQYPSLSSVMRDITSLGSLALLALFTAFAVTYLTLFRSRLLAALVVASILSGTALVALFKNLFGRARPDPALAELSASGLSFPSGHTSMSAIVFLTIGALIAVTHQRAGERAYIVLAACLLTVLVGVSRIALGVHWTTDVIGGWAFGSAWAVVWLQVARMLTNPPAAAPKRTGADG
jgi:undecaprenyl-diphosphatase